MEGKYDKQIQNIHSYLFSLAQLLNMSLDTPTQQSSDSIDFKSPREIFNSIRRLLCSSTELFDSVRQNIMPYLHQVFLSLESFRQYSTNQEEKFTAVEQSILDTESGLNTKITDTNSRLSQIQQSLLDTEQSLQAQIDQLKEAENK